MPLLLALLAWTADEEGPERHPPEPLALRNQHPLSLLFYDFNTAAAAPLPAGQVETAFRLTLTNVYQDGNGSEYDVLFDGEFLRGAFSARWGALDGVELGAEVPLIYGYGGFLDGLFRNYHDLWNLPQTAPDDAPDDRFEVRARRNGETFFEMEGHDVTFGDLNLFAKVRVLDERRHPLTLAARGGIEPPTGSVSRGTSNGHWDGGIGLLAQRTFGIWTPILNVDLMLPGGLDGAKTRPYLASALALRADPEPWAGVILQLDFNTNVLAKTDLPELKRDQLQIVTGLDLRLSRRVSLEIGFAEDLIQSTSPDWTGFIGVRLHF
jgi:hypothetical protein